MKKMFEPVAIIGRACLFPETLNPSQLWQHVLAKNDCLSTADDEGWRINPSLLKDSLTTRGGFIKKFTTVFNSQEFFLTSEEILNLDYGCQWLMHVGREALQDAGFSLDHMHQFRGGIIIGNLSYPTHGLGKYSEAVWLNKNGFQSTKLHPANRFMSGLPAVLMAKALNVKGKAFALDAACASSIYAIKLACDELQLGKADLMLAGAVNASDSLLLNRGFAALHALSKSGNSRPFHKEADGLIPAQGAGIVVLKRLTDAIKDKNKIYGVIRGIGLSNDGRSSGFLIPSEIGQVRAMREAYEVAGIQPNDVSWIECHATGTVVGDATEIRSMKQVFKDQELHIGAIKANIGHSITAAGMAALINVLNAFQAQQKSPTRCASELPADALLNSNFQILDKPTEWKPINGKRIAGINCFGFGGNNAHMIIEEAGVMPDASVASDLASSVFSQSIAIVAISILAGSTKNCAEFSKALFQNQSQIKEFYPGYHGGHMESVDLSIKETKFPPADLKNTLGQQLAILKCAQQIFSEIKNNKPEKTAVLVGMQCDAEITHYGLLLRLACLLPDKDPAWLAATQAAMLKPLNAAYTLGAMPNIVTNRINCQYDLQGPSYSVCAEEISGLMALELGMHELQTSSLDLVLVGAVDMSCEVVHHSALQHLLSLDNHYSGDVAVMIALKRVEDAIADNNTIYAILSDDDKPSLELNNQDSIITKLFGHSHTASGLLHVASAALACHEKLLPFESRLPISWIAKQGKRSAKITSQVLNTDVKKTITISEFIAKHKKSNLKKHPPFISQPIKGEIAFVFTGATASYAGMGHSLFMHYPHLLDAIAKQAPSTQEIIKKMYTTTNWSMLEELQIFSLLSQLHARFTQDILKIKPHATIGYCSGETNALYGLRAWHDLEELYQDVAASELYTDTLAGNFSILPKEWQNYSPKWVSWRVFANVDGVKEIIHKEEKVRLTIINTANDCIIAGNPDACQRVLKKLKNPKANLLNYSMVIHCPEFRPYSEQWRKIHYRKTYSVPDVRFYSTGTGKYYYPTADTAAEALLSQASDTVDFPRVIQNAWNDGVRIFIEHGPRDLCSRFIKEILADKEHLVVSLDHVQVDSLTKVSQAASQLLAAGVEMDDSVFADEKEKVSC